MPALLLVPAAAAIVVVIHPILALPPERVPPDTRRCALPPAKQRLLHGVTQKRTRFRHAG